jgi:hypothetical protein
MALPDQTPRLPKWPFLLGDASLLAAAWFVIDLSPRPLDGLAAAAVAGCAGAAAILGAIPFLSDYARRQDEALDERQRSLEALGRTVQTAAEQIGIVATGFQEIATLSQRNLAQAEQLSNRFREETSELEARLGQIDARTAALRAAVAKAAAPQHKPVRETPAAVPPSPPEPVPSQGPSEPGIGGQGSSPEPVASEPFVEIASPAPESAARPPRKPVVEPDPALPLAEPVPEVSDYSQVQPEEASEPAVSADGATRLLVTAYIGIGNRLFIRGEGPGLTWAKGVPLQFVSIGKWSWETSEASAPVSYKLYKNDEVECVAIGLRRLEAGRQQEITASFDRPA